MSISHRVGTTGVSYHLVMEYHISLRNLVHLLTSTGYVHELERCIFYELPVCFIWLVNP